MAPEQFDGRWRDYGPWTDLYGFGCLVFSLVRGSPPFGATTSYAEKQRQHAEQQPPPLQPPFPVPAGFESWLRRLLEKDPGRRFRRAADARWAFLELGPPDPDGLIAPAQVSADVDTLVLGLPATMTSAGRGDATTLSLRPDELGEVSLTLSAQLGDTPPMPESWRGPADDRDEAPPPSLGLLGLRAVPLVGREAERDRLWDALAEVRRQRRAKLVVLGGPGGCGKTHLARWLCERAHEVGAATVLRATHAPIPGPSHGLGPAIGSFLRCQGLSRPDVLARVEAIFRSHGVEHADEWLALTEVVAPAGPEETGAIRFGSVHERYVTVRRLIQAITIERPVVLWLDDVHWGLDALRFAEHLLDRQRLHPIPVLVVATVTDEALEGRLDESALLTELVERDLAQRIDVGPLPPGPLQELVRGLLGLDADLAARVARRSAGQPMFAVQLVEDWVDGEALELGPDGLRLRADADADLPDDIRDLWRARVERMLARRTPAEERALELAAVLGTDVDVDEWLAVCERSAFASSDRPAIPADPSEELLDGLLAARLARAGEGGPARGWSFAHGMLRECVEQRAAERGRLSDLHRVCAEVLLDRAAAAPRRLPLGLAERLGRHLLASGQAEAALVPLLAAARARHDLADYAAGAALLARRDAAMLELGLPGSDARWGEGWLLAHEILRDQGAYEESEAALIRAEAAARRHGWSAIAASASAHRARLARLAGRYEEALSALSEVERLAAGLGDRRLRAQARWEIGTALAEHGEHGPGERAIRSALADSEAVDDPVGCAHAWQALGEITKETGRHTEAAVLLRQAEALFEACGNRWGMASAINSQGDLARYRGDLSEAERLYRRARGLLRAIGSGSATVTEFNLGLVALARGDADARLLLDRGMDTFVRQGNRPAIAGAHLALAACAALGSRWLEWDEHLDQADALLRETGFVEEDNARTATLAGAAASAAGQADRARRVYLMAWSQWASLRRTVELAAVERELDALGPWDVPPARPRGGP